MHRLLTQQASGRLMKNCTHVCSWLAKTFLKSYILNYREYQSCNTIIYFGRAESLKEQNNMVPL